MTPEEQAAAAQVATQDPSNAPAVAEQPVPTAPPAQPPTSASQGPWDADLAARFPDEATRQQVSAYLGEKVQPYVTNLEQSSAQARELLEDFRSAPKDTFLEVAQELIDEGALAPEDVTEFIGSLTPAEQVEVQEQAEAITAGRDPEVQALIDRDTARQEKEAFDTEYERIRTANPGLEFDEELFIPEVARLGDFDAAVATYREKYGEFLAWRASQPTPEAQPAPSAPQTVGVGEATGGTQPPTAVEYETLDDAIDAHFAERRAVGLPAAPSRPAPPVAAG